MLEDRRRGGSRKPGLYRLAGILISILFVYLAVRRVDLSESIRALGEVRPALLAAATLLYLASFPVRTLRWRRILRAQRLLSRRDVLEAVFVGYMANNVLPARAGELYRAHFLGRRARMSRSGVMASIVVERTFDGLMLILVVLLVLSLFPQAHFLGGAVLLLGLVFLVLAAGILLYVLAVDRTHRVIDRGLGLLPRAIRERLGGRLGDFLFGIRGISTVGGSLEVAAYTVLVWVLEAGAIGLVVASFGIDLPPGGTVLVYAVAAVGTTLPSGPAYIGPYQYAFVLSLGVFAVSPETALAVSVVAQLALLGSVTLIGLALLWREQLRGGSLPGRDGPVGKAPEGDKVSSGVNG